MTGRECTWAHVCDLAKAVPLRSFDIWNLQVGRDQVACRDRGVNNQALASHDADVGNLTE